MRVRIVSPRWDHDTQRWQQPGEELSIPDKQWESEPGYYVHHAVVIPEYEASRVIADIVASEVPEPVAAPAAVVAPADKMARKRTTK